MAQPAWRDLLAQRPAEVAMELMLPGPFFLAAWALFLAPWPLAPWLGVPVCAYGFLALLRVSHGAMHASLGLPRAGNDLVLAGTSFLMLGAYHGYRANHLQHHRDHPQSDREGRSSRYPFLLAMALAPLYPFYLAATGWRDATARDRRWVLAEWPLAAASTALAWLLPWWRWHVAVMVAGQATFAVYAVWLVHRGGATAPSRSQPLGAPWDGLALNLLYHDEHHRHPGVPTKRLPELARRLRALGVPAPPPILTPTVRRWPRLHPLRIRWCPTYRRALRRLGRPLPRFGRRGPDL